MTAILGGVEGTIMHAITEMSPLNNVSAVRRFMKMLNQLAEKATPLHELLSNKNKWNWEEC